MHRDSPIYLAGHTGLVGSALLRKLTAEGYTNLITRTHSELDLERQADVEAFFEAEKPEYVFLAAAKVGGIYANNTYPAEFIYENLAIQTNVIHAAWKAGVKRLLFLGSSCIYPRECPQPMKEEYLLTGPLEPTNEPYAIAKIAGIKMCEAYNRQYGTQFLTVMPTNLYGPNDNFDLETSHVLPALIRKFHLAKLASQGDWPAIQKDEDTYGNIPDDFLANLIAISAAHGHIDKVPDGKLPQTSNLRPKTEVPPTSSAGSQREPERSSNLQRGEALSRRPAVILWGTGKPRREFLHVDDLADACIFLLNRMEDLFSISKGFLPRSAYASGNPVLHVHPVESAGYSTGAPSSMPLINIGCGKDQTIRELAELVRKVVGFDGDIEWDTTKPNGTPRKLLGIRRITQLGWKPKIPLEKGIRLVYEDYLSKIKR